MTEQFKQTLFDYLTGKLEFQQGADEEIFKEINTLPLSDWPFDDNILPKNGWNEFRYEGLIQDQNSELLVLYGGYKTRNNEIRGIITIVDNKFNPIKSFFQFDSGTSLQYIMCMIQEEDGTFTMITCPDFPRDEEWSFTSSTKKFTMVNNFTQQINNECVLTLQKSYDMPYKNNYVRKMFKDPNSSHYILLCSILSDRNSFDKSRIIEVKINVGSSNEWSYTDTDDYWILGDSYVEFDSDGNSFVELILTSSLNSDNRIGLWTKDFDDSSYTFSTIHTFSYKPYIDSHQINNQSVFLNKNEFYFVQNNQHWGNYGRSEAKYIGLYYYNIQTKEFKTIYEKYLGDYDYCNLESIYITSCNNKLYIEFNDNINSSNVTADYYFQRLENNKWSPIKVSKNQFFRYSTRALYVSNQFNLLNCLSYMTNPQNQYWYLLNILENYSESKYNGQPYINTNAMIADNAEIYSNDSLVFARDLYNKTLNNNTTVATVEVPNNYLNDIDITSKNLLSETNMNIIEDTNMMQKNVYETLYINFINTLLIADRNNATQVLNQQASTYLNSAINTDDSYDNAKLYENILITYQDGSTAEIKYGLEDVTDTSENIVFGIYVDKPINDAKIVSNDKTITYQTIDLTSLEQGKNYNIKQKLEVL